MQTQGVELDMGRQVGFDAGGEIREHILARRLIIDQHDAAEATADLFRYTGAFGRAAHDESMVEAGEGFDVCALIGICVQDPMYMMQTMEKLKEIPEIVECHFITGNFNILVKLYCLDNEHLMKTIFDGILRIQGISTTQTFISLNEAFQRQVSIDFIRAAER